MSYNGAWYWSNNEQDQRIFKTWLKIVVATLQRRCIIWLRLIPHQLIAIFLVFVISGCSGLSGHPPTTFPDQKALENNVLALRQTDIDTYLGTDDDTVRRNQRDRFVIERMAAIDANFYEYVRSIYGEDVAAEVAIQWIAIGTATAGALVSNSTTQSILAGATAALLGAKAAFDKAALFDQTVPALMSQMKANRLVVGERILDGISKPVFEYDLIRARLDIQEYYSAGTIPGALNAVSESAGATAEAAIERIQFRVDSTRTIIQEYLCADDECLNFKPGRLNDVRQCMRDENIPSGRLLTDFIFKPEFAVERTKVGACLQR